MSDPSTYDGGALLVLEEQLRREMTRVEERRRDLEASRDLLARITSQALGAHEPLSEPIADALAPSVVSRLLAETTGLLRNYVLTIVEGPALDESTMRANEERIRRGEEQRAVYPASALSTPQGQRWMTSWAEVGEDQRILPTTDTEFAVFGVRGRRRPRRVGRPGRRLRRHPRPARRAAVHRLLRPRRGARPSPPRRSGARARGDPKLVELLELGLKDEAIARYLGVSLRTVRRRVAHLMAVNGVDTRFQLGWALARRRR